MPDLPASDCLDRYRSIAPDWPAFLDALSRPLPLCLWTNTLRATEEEVAWRLGRAGIDVRPVAWYPGAFKGRAARRAGQSLPFVAGLYHIQEEVSLLPVMLLAPSPGERVLDLCSAPGNKTAQIAVALRNTGTIVANDRSALRSRATRGVLDRLGVVNTTITTADAENLPDRVGRFDCVLADVPCTCQGTARKHINALVQSGRTASLGLHRRQLAILRKAIQLCRPGGRIVYATCTFAPEENEMVVDAALREHAGLVSLLPARIEGVVSSPGLTEWEGSTYDPAMALAMRIWPHQNDSGGFFVAVLSKSTGAGAAGCETIAASDFALPSDRAAKWKHLLIERFGFPEAAFDGLSLHQPNKKVVAAVASDHETVRRPATVSTGMPLVRVALRHPKLTTAGARLLGRLATRNVVRADETQVRAYVRRDDFAVSEDQQDELTGTGYVLVAHDNLILGVGLYLDANRTVKSMFPKVLVRAASR